MRIAVSTEIDGLIRHAVEAVAHARREGGNQLTDGFGTPRKGTRGTQPPIVLQKNLQ